MMTMRAIFINFYFFIMNKPHTLSLGMSTRETLILKTLAMKALHNGADSANFIDSVLAQNPEQADQITKNVCARIPLSLAEEMESVGALLSLNKREIITMAVVDFLNQAHATIREFDAMPSQDDEA
jgi:hypothetical protein